MFIFGEQTYINEKISIKIKVTIQHLRLGMLRIPRCGAARGAARLVRPKITVIIRPKCKHFVLYSNSYLGVLNNYKKRRTNPFGSSFFYKNPHCLLQTDDPSKPQSASISPILPSRMRPSRISTISSLSWVPAQRSSSAVTSSRSSFFL